MSVPEPTEAELRAALQAEMEQLTVDDVLLQTLVSLLNLAAARAGLVAPEPGRQPPAGPDWPEVGRAIDGARALMVLVEPRHGPQLGPMRDALAQLQLNFARANPATGGDPAPGGGEPAPQAPPAPGAQPGAGPAQSSGRLWVPGQ